MAISDLRLTIIDEISSAQLQRYFILEELYKQHVTNLQQIVNVAKILCLELPNVKFIDSMNFFPMALSNFPKTLGLMN